MSREPLQRCVIAFRGAAGDGADLEAWASPCSKYFECLWNGGHLQQLLRPVHNPIKLFPFFWAEPAGMTNIEGGQSVILDAFAEFTFDDEQEMARRVSKYV